MLALIKRVERPTQKHWFIAAIPTGATMKRDD
jgi:hypothetical protein